MKLKRVLIMVSVLVFSLCLGLAVGCDDDTGKTTHTTHTGTEWSSDETNHWKVCTECNQKFEEAAHKFENGVCTVCGRAQSQSGGDGSGGDTFDEDWLNPLPGNNPNCEHDWGEWVTRREKSCTEDGVRNRTCSKCGKREVDIRKSTGHNLVHRAGVKPTCTTPGTTDYEMCVTKGCGYSTEEPLPALGHDLEDVAAKDASCTEVGWTAYQRCKRCDYTTIDDPEKDDHYIKLLDHQYESDDKEAKCKICGKTRFIASEGLEIVDAGTMARVVGIGTCTDTVISIPEEYNGKPVTEIADRAFCTQMASEYYNLSDAEKAKVDEEFARLNKVTVINMRSILRISTGAFCDMDSLETVDLGDSLQRIGSSVFALCYKVEKITIPKTCTYIEGDAFWRCDNLSEIEVDSENTAFKVVKDKFLISQVTGELKFVCFDKPIYDDNGEQVPNTSEEVLEIPEEVKSIGFRAFSYHVRLKKITIPGTVKTISGEAFYICAGLEEVVLEAGVESIAEGAFSSCTRLRYFEINTKLVKATDENGEEVERGSFRVINQNTFGGCSSLEEIVFNGTKEQWKQVQKYGTGLLNSALKQTNVNGQISTQQILLTIKCSDGNLKENSSGAFVE